MYLRSWIWAWSIEPPCASRPIRRHIRDVAALFEHLIGLQNAKRRVRRLHVSQRGLASRPISSMIKQPVEQSGRYIKGAKHDIDSDEVRARAGGVLAC